MQHDMNYVLSPQLMMAMAIIRPCRSQSVVAYSRQTFCQLSCSVHCGKMADRIRMPFGITGQTGPGMRQVVQFGDQSTGSGTFGGEFGARHCNQWGLYGVHVLQSRNMALFPNYFGQTCYTYHRVIWTVWIKFSVSFLSPMLQRDRDESRSGSYGSGTGAGLTTAGPGRERE